jgi:hypothetical protein
MATAAEQIGGSKFKSAIATGGQTDPPTSSIDLNRKFNAMSFTS